ncbi:S41 family peptidase [Kitasatospora sp. NPDC054939]
MTAGRTTGRTPEGAAGGPRAGRRTGRPSHRGGRPTGKAAAARTVAATVVALAVAAGAAAPALAAPGDARRPGANRLDGVWQTDGYGTVLEIAGGKLTTYDLTRVSCTEGGGPGRQFGEPGRDGATRYGPEGSAFAELTITPQGRHRAVQQEDSSVGTRSLNRLPGLPALCREPVEDDGPLAVFDRFWATFEENYPFFAAKGVDWHAVRDTYRPQVTAQTGPDRLQQIFAEMLAPLNDAHVALRRPVGGKPTTVFSGSRPGTVMPTPDLMVQAGKPVAAQLLAPERTFGSGMLGVGELPGGLRYLRVSLFGNYVPDGSHQDDTAELDRALDALLADRAGLRGLVVDVRVNGGGSDALALQIASRLTDRPYTAYRKVARNDPAAARRYTRPQPIAVRPAAGPRWTGPVAVLTAGSTVSAGETFTQALMGRSPHVTRIGENTQGVFSDVLVRKLSAEFTAVLPNEKFLAPDGSSFDGPGIPPDVRTPVFTPEELNGLKDSALTRARRLLGG